MRISDWSSDVCSSDLCFVGLVREMGGNAQSSMTLEHYPGMTEKKLAEIEAEARARWPLDASLVIHRYGRLEPGDRIVMVATAAAHRSAALAARSEEHTSELQSLMRNSYAVFCLKKKKLHTKEKQY